MNSDSELAGSTLGLQAQVANSTSKFVLNTISLTLSLSTTASIRRWTCIWMTRFWVDLVQIITAKKALQGRITLHLDRFLSPDIHLSTDVITGIDKTSVNVSTITGRLHFLHELGLWIGWQPLGLQVRVTNSTSIPILSLHPCSTPYVSIIMQVYSVHNFCKHPEALGIQSHNFKQYFAFKLWPWHTGPQYPRT